MWFLLILNPSIFFSYTTLLFTNYMEKTHRCREGEVAREAIQVQEAIRRGRLQEELGILEPERCFLHGPEKIRVPREVLASSLAKESPAHRGRVSRMSNTRTVAVPTGARGPVDEVVNISFLTEEQEQSWLSNAFC